MDWRGGESREVLRWGFLNSHFQTGIRNLLDFAILNEGMLVCLHASHAPPYVVRDSLRGFVSGVQQSELPLPGNRPCLPALVLASPSACLAIPPTAAALLHWRAALGQRSLWVPRHLLCSALVSPPAGTVGVGILSTWAAMPARQRPPDSARPAAPARGSSMQWTQCTPWTRRQARQHTCGRHGQPHAG
jgi:hypothetical protein